MIGHDAPCLQPIASRVEVLEGFDHHLCDVRFCEMADPRPKIEMMFNFLRC